MIMFLPPNLEASLEQIARLLAKQKVGGSSTPNEMDDPQLSNLSITETTTAESDADEDPATSH